MSLMTNILCKSIYEENNGKWGLYLMTQHQKIDCQWRQISCVKNNGKESL